MKSGIRSGIRSRAVQKVTSRGKLAHMIRRLKILSMSNVDLRELEAAEVRDNPASEIVLGSETVIDLAAETAIKSEKEWIEFAGRAIRKLEPTGEPPKDDVPVSAEVGIRQQLEGQITDLSDPAMRPFVHILLAYLNENGLLESSIEEIAAGTTMDDAPNETVGVRLDAADLEQARQILMRLDPAGIGAMTVQESLLVRMETKADDPRLATLVRDHFEDLGHGRFQRIAKAMHVSVSVVEQLRKSLAEHYSPYPIYGLVPIAVQHIAPDLIVSIENGELRIIPTRESYPRIFVSEGALKALDSPHTTTVEKIAMLERIDRVRRKRDDIIARMTRLMQVAEVVFVRQRESIEKGMQYLKPCIMKELANELEITASTMTRAVADKWVETPFGLVPFRKFFAEEIDADVPGGTLASDIMAAILAVVEAEDSRKPLSDRLIADKLASDYGFRIAQRTVNKYRTRAGIPGRSERRHG